jgi:ATP-dependent protease HslVU (ClpYQ) peptidase subunit
VPDLLLENDDKFEAILIDPDGNCFNVECGYLVPVIADYAAIGSGGMFALGAMAHGASSADAVAAAARHDKNTGGNIQSLHFSMLGLNPS